MKQDILKYLKEDERFRERANKNRGIANLISKKYGIEIPKDKRDDIIGDILTADRSWRMALKEEPSLRGKDYNDGEVLSQEWQLNNGYEPQLKLKI
jgi:hypothetical protein